MMFFHLSDDLSGWNYEVRGVLSLTEDNDFDNQDPDSNMAKWIDSAIFYLIY
jgi:hypothetical protein